MSDTPCKLGFKMLDDRCRLVTAGNRLIQQSETLLIVCVQIEY